MHSIQRHAEIADFETDDLGSRNSAGGDVA
jgi:hypothetical protein